MPEGRRAMFDNRNEELGRVLARRMIEATKAEQEDKDGAQARSTALDTAWNRLRKTSVRERLRQAIDGRKGRDGADHRS